MFEYVFMIRAVVVGIMVSVCASLLGVNMVLKRYSMIGDGLSHVGFAALAAAAAAGVAPLKFAIPICIIAAFFMLRLSSSGKMKGDQTVALVCSGSLAIGVMIISMSTGMNTDVNNYMFGSILALSREDTILSIILSVIVFVVFVIFYNRLFAVTFDENFAKATGTNAGAYNAILAVLTAVTVVIGMRMMGALLISSLIIFPAISSMRVCRHYRAVIISSVIISIVCFMAGITLSFYKSTPAGASVVCFNIAIFGVYAIIGTVRNNFTGKIRK